jgi:hypothetical protein
MNWPKPILALSMGILLLGIAISIEAAISISSRTGNLSVTTPEGNFLTVTTNDDFPNLGTGSVVEVLSGNAEFALREQEFITLIAGESVMNLDGWTQVSIMVENNGADTKISVHRGNIEVTLGENILSIETGGGVQAIMTEGNVAVELLGGEVFIRELSGDQTQILPGHTYSLGAVIPTFEESFF